MTKVSYSSHQPLLVDCITTAFRRLSGFKFKMCFWQGLSTDAADALVQANIVAAGYSTASASSGTGKA